MSISEEKKREILIKNYNKKYIENLEELIEISNKYNLPITTEISTQASCGDKVYSLLIIENDIINKCFFYSDACFLTTSCLYTFEKYIESKKKSTFIKILDNFKKMFLKQEFCLDDYEELTIFENINYIHYRYNCIKIIIDLLEKYI